MPLSCACAVITSMGGVAANGRRARIQGAANTKDTPGRSPRLKLIEVMGVVGKSRLLLRRPEVPGFLIAARHGKGTWRIFPKRCRRCSSGGLGALLSHTAEIDFPKGLPWWLHGQGRLMTRCSSTCRGWKVASSLPSLVCGRSSLCVLFVATAGIGWACNLGGNPFKTNPGGSCGHPG